jgi:hypothetical protein
MRTNYTTSKVTRSNDKHMKNFVGAHKAGFVLTALFILILPACKAPDKTTVVSQFAQELSTNTAANGPEMIIDFKKGKAFNYPLMAIWVEDTAGRFIQNLYVSESIAKGIFDHGVASKGKWLPGKIRRPAALPYWGHKYGVKAEYGLFLPTPENPIPDAFTGATPLQNFRIHTRLNDNTQRKFNVLFEINQTWDWNEYWTNSKFPDDEEYKTSCQPALVYSAAIDLDSDRKEFPMKVIGHSHYSGKDGNLYTDLSTLTTALQIAESIVVSIK